MKKRFVFLVGFAVLWGVTCAIFIKNQPLNVLCVLLGVVVMNVIVWSSAFREDK